MWPLGGLALVLALAFLVGLYARVVYEAANRAICPPVAALWRFLAWAEQAMDEDADRRAASIRERRAR